MIREKIITNFNKEKLLKLPDILYRFKELYTVIFYGSRATDKYTELSDIDLFYLSKIKFSLKDEADILYEITKYLDIMEVDFTNLKRVSLKKKYEILTNGKLIFCSDENSFIDYKEKITLRFFDFKPYYDEYIACLKKNIISGELINI